MFPRPPAVVQHTLVGATRLLQQVGQQGQRREVPAVVDVLGHSHGCRGDPRAGLDGTEGVPEDAANLRVQSVCVLSSRNDEVNDQGEVELFF
jgi:hypothetical protein